MSTSTEYATGLNAPAERRFYHRVTPSAPIYVAFGPNNLGSLLNVSENGLQVATPAPLDLNSVYRVFLSLDGATSAITVSVRTIWTDKSQNSSGIQLLDLSEQSREQIRNWVAMQTPRTENLNEGLEDWFSTKRADTLPDIVEQALDAAPKATEFPKKSESSKKPEFPPMPLPIHGEFTYEPPPASKKGRRVVRTRRSRFSTVAVALRTVVIVMVCVAGWSFRQNLSDVIGGYLHRRAQVAKESAPSIDPGRAEVSPGGSLAKASERPGTLPPTGAPLDSNAGPRPGKMRDAGSNTPAAPLIVAPKASPSSVASSKRHEVSAPKPNLSTLQKLVTETEAPEVPRSHAEDSAPVTNANNDAISAPEPMPAPPPPTAPKPATTPSVASAAASTNPSAKVLSADSRKSAIVGSISNPGRPGDLPTGRQPASAPASSPTLGSSSTSRARANSSVSSGSGSNPGNPPVIQMDVPEPRVVEVTPPRSLTGALTASYVDLPGERVLHSPAFTIHIQRSVKIPRERIPGERWLWRGHKKVVVGELASRIDPQMQPASTPYGSVAVEATIDKDGHVSEVRPLYGSYAVLSNVFKAIRDWRYEPTYLDNKPVETQAKIEIDFRPVSARVNKPQ